MHFAQVSPQELLPSIEQEIRRAQQCVCDAPIEDLPGPTSLLTSLLYLHAVVRFAHKSKRERIGHADAIAIGNQLGKRLSELHERAVIAFIERVQTCERRNIHSFVD